MNQTSGKKDLAYASIKEKILNGTLAPLEDISEEALMSELSISRTPIREAFQKLEKEGFVYIYPRKGTIVSEISVNLVNQIYDVRFLVEPFAARQACNKVDESLFRKLREEFLNDVSTLSEDEKVRYYTDLDRRLHGEILKYCANPFLENLLSVIRSHNQRIRMITSRQNPYYLYAIKEHVGIIDAYLNHDEEQIEKATLTHLESSKKYAMELFG